MQLPSGQLQLVSGGTAKSLQAVTKPAPAGRSATVTAAAVRSPLNCTLLSGSVGCLELLPGFAFSVWRQVNQSAICECS